MTIRSPVWLWLSCAFHDRKIHEYDDGLAFKHAMQPQCEDSAKTPNRRQDLRTSPANLRSASRVSWEHGSGIDVCVEIHIRKDRSPGDASATGEAAPPGPSRSTWDPSRARRPMRPMAARLLVAGQAA